MKTGRQVRLISAIKKLSANFFSRRLEPGRLITVNNVALSDNGEQATIFLTIFPDAGKNEEFTLALKQMRDLRKMLKHNLSNLKTFPYLTLAINEKEKNKF